MLVKIISKLEGVGIIPRAIIKGGALVTVGVLIVAFFYLGSIDTYKLGELTAKCGMMCFLETVILGLVFELVAQRRGV